MNPARQAVPAPLPRRPPRLIQAEGAAAIHHWAAPWRRLEAEAAAPNPFLSFAWQSAWVESHERAAPVLFAERGGDGEPTGLLACQRSRRHGLRRLELLAQGAGGDDLDTLADPADAAIGRRLLAAALALPGWDWLRFESVRPDGMLAAAFAEARAPGCVFRREPGECLPFLALPPSFERLLALHSSNFREQIRRRRRQFARRFPEARLHCLQSAEDLLPGLEHLFRLHNLRRAHKGGRGIFETPALRRFHRLAALRLAESGQASLYLLRTPQLPIAALYGFTAGDRFFFFQSGLDPEFIGLSPGTVLMSGVIEDCIHRGLRQFEFLRGSETYKSRWTAQSRSTVNLFVARGRRGRGALCARQFARAARRRLFPRPTESTPPEES